MGIQFRLDGGAFEVEEIGAAVGDCDIRCLKAREKRCVCRCGGRNHGALRFLEENESLDGEQRYIWLGHIEEIADLFKGYVCPSCGTPFSREEIWGYPHDGGLYVENYMMKLWIFGRCRKCGYDTAWWKLGRSLLTTPAGWG
jgi:hypothetical protein